MLLVTAQAADLRSLERTVREEMTQLSIPGAAVAVVEKGNVVFRQAFGVASIETKSPVTEQTLFRLGSTSKVFTAMAALRLVDQGKLDMHAPIGRYGAPPRLASLTMQQLLTHTAGLADDAPQNGPHDEAALAANVESWGSDMLFAPPGKLFSYANPGYVLAGYVIEKITGKPFAEAIAELVFRPTGMATATYRPFDAITYPLALPHSPGPALIRPFPDHAGAWPPGSAFASAEDAAKFLLAAMKEPRLFAPQADILGDGRKYSYGVILDGDRAFHTGARLGYGSRFEIDRANETAAFFMANRTSALFSKSAVLVQAASASRATAQAQPLPEQEAAALAGRYLNRGAIRVELSATAEGLQVKLGTRAIAAQQVGKDMFVAKGAAQLERFRVVRDSAGRPEFICAEVWCMRRQ